jgi:23S rRNA pseudouridine1911/1915/1917 synthase
MNTACFSVDESLSGQRLDVAIASAVSSISRSRAQQSIREGCVQVNDQAAKPSCRVQAGDRITLSLPDPVPLEAEPEDIALDIVYEDDWVIVINKPAHLVVHPACGNYTGTLVNALLFHCRDLAGIGGVQRPGIVHRLDKDTSGIMVVAKNEQAHVCLSEQFRVHSVVRRYQALVFGSMAEDCGRIETLIGRDRVDRKKMSVHPRRGRQAVTDWRCLERFDDYSLLEVELQTGRTHQVRVHLASIGHSVLGDQTYGNPRRLRLIKNKTVQDAVKGLKRHLLHAGFLQFTHPDTRQVLAFTAPLPDEFAAVLTLLRGQ